MPINYTAWPPLEQPYSVQTGYNQQEWAFQVLLSPQGPSAHLTPNPLLHLVFLTQLESNSWHRVGATTHHCVQPGLSWTKGLQKVTMKKICSEDGNIFAEVKSILKWPVRGKKDVWMWSLTHIIIELLRLENTSRTSSPTLEWRIRIYSL